MKCVAGGIGFDVADTLTHGERHPSLEVNAFLDEWGIDKASRNRGGLQEPHHERSPRHVWLLQRKSEKMGKNLGKTTGWIHRVTLKERGVTMMTGEEA